MGNCICFSGFLFFLVFNCFRALSSPLGWGDYIMVDLGVPDKFCQMNHVMLS